MHNTFNHHEIPARDPESLGKFYGSVFDWKLEKQPGPREAWVAWLTGEPTGGTVGIHRKEQPNDSPATFFVVDSIADFTKKVEQLGGRLLVPRDVVPGQGYFAVAMDPEGNPFGGWEYNPSAK